MDNEITDITHLFNHLRYGREAFATRDQADDFDDLIDTIYCNLDEILGLIFVGDPLEHDERLFYQNQIFAALQNNLSNSDRYGTNRLIELSKSDQTND